MNYERLKQIIRKYSPEGIIKGGELLLPPHIAMMYADDLRNIGIKVMGVDGWKVVDAENYWIAQDLEVDFTVPDDILYREDAVEESFKLVIDFVRKQSAKHVAFVSYTLDIPMQEGELLKTEGEG